MLPLFFCEQGSNAPAGQNANITLRRATTFSDGWTATAYFGGTSLGSFTSTRQLDAMQRAMIVAGSYWVDVFYGSVDPDN